MACEKSTDLPSSDLVTQQTVSLDQDEVTQEEKNPNNASGISTLKEEEHKDVKDCSTTKKKKKKNKKKKKKSPKDEHRTQGDKESATIPDEEPSIGTEDTLTVSQVQKEKETFEVSFVDSKVQREKELGDENTAPCGSGDTQESADDNSSEVAEAKREVAHNVLLDCKGNFQEISEGAHGVTTSEKDESETGDGHASTSMSPEEELCHVAKDNSPTTTSHEERNILCIFKLVYGVGLRALRRLFMEIHPSWSNLPTDAAGLDKGGMKLRKDEECTFNTGNIDEWDFSLITSVLLFSKRCALEISKRPHHEASLRDLKDYRNRLLGHPSNDKMSDSDFNFYWLHLSSNFVTLGASSDEIAEIIVQSDDVLHSGDYYRNLFLREQEKEYRCEKKLDAMNSKLDAIMAHQRGSDVAEAPSSPKNLSSAKWDEWLKFRDAIGDFQVNQNQYILVADAMSPEDLECFSRLRSVAWKMILDFDPMSEEKGFYQEFNSAEGQSNLVSMFTPAELERSTMGNLIRQLDPNKTQWLFVNGRFSDTDGRSQTFPDWEANSVKHISRFLGCCSDPDKFDKQKPVVCLILPFCEQNVPHLEVTLSRLLENFNDFNLQFVSFRHQHCHRVPRKFMVRNFDLSPNLVNLGLKEMLCTSTTQEYRMPTSHAGVPAKLTHSEYLYLKEHLQILYDGCEDLPEPTSDDPAEADKQLKDFFEEHKRSFISGNQISFVSLYDNHDAKREIESQIRTHIQRVLDQGLTRSLIVEIRHSPGTGGTTIARRVMWDLSKAYPCAFVEVSSPHYFDEDNIIARHLVNRILALEEICHTTPVILIDGKQSGVTEGFSNKLVRMLCNTGKRALLLRCLHGAKPSKTQESSHVHHVFNVNVKLEDSIADLREFRSKYNEYFEESLGQKASPDLCRVFHFPLLAMMEEFRPKLQKIIDDTLSEMGGLQQEIAVIVAFLQKYANHATPALLLYEAFKDFIRVSEVEKCASYEVIARQLFTEHLLNLMVPTNPLRRRRRSDPLREPPPESYTLQHYLVADLVLRNFFREQDRDLFDVVRKFLQFPIYQHERFLSLFQELFAYNKFGWKLKFSILFEDLKRINSEQAAEVFCEAAEKTNDPVIFTNAARFLAKKDPPSFSQAKQLIQRAFLSMTHSPGHFRPRVLCHSKGVVLFSELKHIINSGEVKDLGRLEELASSVLEAYHEARNSPPTYPHPLIGEVEVWLTSIDWIVRNICGGDSHDTLKFLTKQSPPFFRTCVSDSFYLLDVVDGIVQSVPNLTDPEETQRRCNNARLSLMSIFKRRHSQSERRRDSEDLVQVCKALCTAKNFPKSSQLELKKLQAQFMLSSGVQIDTLGQENLSYLLRLLDELVLMENEYGFAYLLMKVCVLVTGPRCYTLEQGLNISEKWLEVSHYDCLPYFYQMAIYFLKILDGYTVEFMPHYKKALKKCREKSQNNLRSTQSTLFVGRGGRGMSRLTTRNTLFLGETDYSTDDSEKVKNFWLVDSRKKLLECKGRIRMGQSSGRGKSHPYIELLQGNVELYVGKNSDIGKVERDFTPGTLAYFVVSFNLQGPVANGISLSPQLPLHQ